MRCPQRSGDDLPIRCNRSTRTHCLPVDPHHRARHPVGGNISSISFSTSRVWTSSPASSFHRGELLAPNTRSPHRMTKRLDRVDVQTSSRRKSSARLKRAHGKSHPRSVLSINAPSIISAAHQLVLRSGDDPAVHPKRRGLIKACRVWRIGFQRAIWLVE